MKKILVIDDDQDTVEVLKCILMSRDFDIQIHSTGLGVPDIVMNYNPSLILLDVRLPGISGIEISKSLKQGHCVPIILISAHSEHQESLTESKADAFIVKPFDIDQLVNKIKLCVSSL